MEWLTMPKKMQSFLKKYKYVLIVFLVGAVLMFLPNGDKQKENTEYSSPKIMGRSNIEQDLEKILSQVSGAGRVSVMLTTAEGEKTYYQSNTDTSNDHSSEDTVILTDAQRSQNGLITQVNPPIYQGAIIVCDGADDPVVHLTIVEAVSRATGLGANNISVLKMN